MESTVKPTRKSAKEPGRGELPELPQVQCVYHLLEAQAERIPNATAIAGLERDPLTYSHLHTHIEDMVRTLNSMGVGRNDRVAIVLPNGPEMALAFLAVSACATSAPLNPAYRSSEFEFYLSDLNAKALIIQSGIESPAIDVARSRGIPVIKLSPVLKGEAGIFRLKCDKRQRPVYDGFAQPDDVALILHTSGTTSRPKIVPLAHTNICTSANNIRKTLHLSADDRCLNVMPLFHIHGLMGAILSSLAAGASIVCAPGFYAPRFFEWMDEFHPTWYTAVPTMHQAILTRASSNRQSIERCPLRFIRSSSASLPPQVMAALEKEFDAPVIESYGMTEAAHQMTSNPLPPGGRKAGSVGMSAGPEVAIMDETGNLLSAGEKGEIVIRGDNVMRGYENNPEANKSAFTNGWFRTGDQGHLDTSNYLFITGRLKEIINRAGEKISPREVDEVLMKYPAVMQAVTFAVPHSKLGEDVAAAVVLHEKRFATETSIQEFAARRIANFKVPRRILIVGEIPKGPTGKLQRIGLAEKLGLTMPDSTQPGAKAEFVAPRTPVERELVEIWEQVIGVQSIGIRDNFFELGGDSMLAAQMFAQIQKAFGRNLPLTILFQSPTIEQLATILGQKGKSSSSSLLVPIQSSGSRPSFFCIHGCLGEVLNYFALARYLGQEQPFYALKARGMYGERRPPTRYEDMAACYIEEIRAVQPEGPYFLGGSGTGGWIALEAAQQLLEQSQEVALLVLMDTTYRFWSIPANSSESDTPGSSSSPSSRRSLSHYSRRLFYHLRHRQLRQVLRGLLNRYYRKYYHRFAYSSIPRHISYIQRRINYIKHIRSFMIQVHARYVPQVYPGRITYFMSELRRKEPHSKWYELAAGGLDVYKMPGHHTSMLREPYVRVVAEQLRTCLDEAQAK